ncbi:hypothetical protein, partial [Mycobacterium attenuatum]|uniref:hypothetical protein n=1 Tax=Mycobacterium attenuatum TaxID=2341086 RepID=UPI001B7D530E
TPPCPPITLASASAAAEGMAVLAIRQGLGDEAAPPGRGSHTSSSGRAARPGNQLEFPKADQ